MGDRRGARVISAGANFSLNRHLVFPENRTGSLKGAALSYVGLATLLSLANYVLLLIFTDAGLPSLPAKILTEILL